MKINHQMNNYEYNEGIEFYGLMPKFMEATSIKTIGKNELEVIDYQETAWGGGMSPEPEPEPEPEPDTHEYVDLGLPSKTLWATTNIQDADGNELYFAWGETSGYTKSQITDKVRGFSLQSYGYNENPSTLDAEHDAATVNWGSDWKMPTEENFNELLNNTKKTFDGDTLILSSENGKSIEFKALGYAQNYEVLDEGNFGHYWTSSLGESNNAKILYFSEAMQLVDDDSRLYGRLIRPIKS